MLHISSTKGYEKYDSIYTVKVNGNDCLVHPCRVSGMPFNAFWPGHQRDKSQSEIAYFINAFGDEVLNFEVKCSKEFKTAVVRPLSKNFKVSTDGDVIRFTVEKNGNYVLELDDIHCALHIFYSEYKQPVREDEVTYYFGPGVHNPLLISLKSNESLYIHPDAIVYTAVFFTGRENVRIFGGGILDNSCQERVGNHCLGEFPFGNIRVYNSKNVHIEDVVLRDSANWVCAMFNSQNIFIDNIKIIGQWRYNTDGIDLTNCSDVTIKNCFIRSFDDSICVKATHNFTVCENFNISNCVCWCDWGKTLELGLETAADTYRNIHYKDCDLIHNKAGALAISNGHYADIYNISYENINVEYQANNEYEMLQRSDDMVYDKRCGMMAMLFRFDNTKFSQSYDTSLADEKDLNWGYTHDVSINNINVYVDEGMDAVPLILYSNSDTAPVENVYIENIAINGKPVSSLNELKLHVNNATNVTYNGKKML